MMLTERRKAFLEELPKVVKEAVETYGTRLRGIRIEEDAKGCYTVLISYDSEFRP
jgi:vacuolar-type H+-ATPase subunit E/Vma4